MRKKSSLIIIFLCICLLLSGCNHNIQPMGYVIPEITHGDIACSGRKEAYYAYTIIEKLYEAKPTNDVHAIYDLFSEKAKENKQLTNTIQELLAVFPENDIYTGVTITSEGFERTIHTHSIEVLLTFTQNDKISFKMQIIYYIENDENPSYEGIHLIELYPYNSIESAPNFKWKTSEHDTGIYLYL